MIFGADIFEFSSSESNNSGESERKVGASRREA